MTVRPLGKLRMTDTIVCGPIDIRRFAGGVCPTVSPSMSTSARGAAFNWNRRVGSSTADREAGGRRRS
jgi:hypothetical protein